MAVNQSEQRFFQYLAKHENEQSSGEALFLKFGGEMENIAIENATVPARDGYEIPIRIFNADIKNPGPVLLMYPGGGYVMNMFEACAIACSRIAKYSGLKVILINYRLLPENSMPVPIQDALDATIYIAHHANQFGLDPEKLVISGFSIGAHCAAVIANHAATQGNLKIRQQILLNGAYDAFLHKRDYAEYEVQDQMVSREVINQIYQLWGLSDAELRSPFYSPYYNTDFRNLPQTTFVIAEFDGMRSDSEKYFLKLQKNGCQVSKIILPGQCHHTMLLRGAISDVEDPAAVIAKIFMR